MDYYNNLHCDNKELIEELKQKEELFGKISEKLLRCPHCKTGHFFLERDDREYSSDAWWMCDNCLECDGTPSKAREQLIEDIVQYGSDEYWDFGIFSFVEEFEYGDFWQYENEKKREFDAEEFNKEKHKEWISFDEGERVIAWQPYVEKTIRDHIKALDTAIERAKKVKMLKSIFKENRE